MTPREIRLKGQAFKGLLWAVEQRHGAATLERVLQGTPEEFRLALQYGKLVSGGWYPVSWYRELYESIGRVLGRSQDIPRDLSRVAVERDLNQVYRFVLAFVSPVLMLDNWHRLWSLYCDGGKLAVEHIAERELKLHFSECCGQDRSCWLDLSGGIEATLTACRGKNPRVRLLNHGTPQEGTATMHCAWDA